MGFVVGTDFYNARVIVEPLSSPLSSPLPPEEALLRLAAWPHVALLDSSRAGDPQSRWSFLTADPVSVQTIAGVADPATLGLPRPLVAPANAPPFCGGLVGCLSYDYGRRLERLDAPAVDEFALPVAVVGEYDFAVAWNHATGECILAAETRSRADAVREQLRQTPSPQVWTRPDPVDIATLQHPVAGAAGVTSNFSRAAYLDAVEAMRAAIGRGDIFQANLAQRLLAPATCDPLDLYRRLRRHSPAPMAAYFDAGPYRLLSTSPERFLQINAGRIETRPIKGTWRRLPRPEADLFTRDALLESEKDRAENVMIVDLMRNDLSRVCRDGSMRVPSLCQVETYENVQHLVSVVTAELADGLTPLDVLDAVFPGGSITGCPKIEAMNRITQLEGVARGPYCGSLFYWGHAREGHGIDGEPGSAFDASILIRTVIDAGGWWQLPVGGGITWDSRPAAEHQETLDKATAMLAAIAD